MNWTALGESDLAARIANGVAAMTPPARMLWDSVSIPPVKWQLHPWGDDGGGFWVVGIIGQQVIWYNDIELGFNISRYENTGIIAQYLCNQDDLSRTINLLLAQIETGDRPGGFGPPETLA